MLKCDDVHSKDQLQWHSLVFSLSLLFIWSKKDNYVDTFWSFNKAQKDNYVDTFWSFNKAQGLQLGYVPSTTTQKPPLRNSDFSAPIGEIPLICFFTLIRKGLSLSMILYGEFGLNLDWSSNGNCFQRHLKLI